MCLRDQYPRTVLYDEIRLRCVLHLATSSLSVEMLSAIHNGIHRIWRRLSLVEQCRTNRIPRRQDRSQIGNFSGTVSDHVNGHKNSEFLADEI
jgi:hypothetical protein